MADTRVYGSLRVIPVENLRSSVQVKQLALVANLSPLWRKSLGPSNPHEESVMEQQIVEVKEVEVIELSLEEIAQVGGGYSLTLL